MAALAPAGLRAVRPRPLVLFLLLQGLVVVAALPARCGSTWSDANDVCPQECQTTSDCFYGTCWGGLTFPCNASLTSRCGLSWDSAISSCNSVCDGLFAPNGCAGSQGKPCSNDSDCGAGRLSCFNGLPTWPCEITSATRRCGVSWSKANSMCGKVCQNRGNCEVECYGQLDESACEPGTTTTVPVRPPPPPGPPLGAPVPAAVIACIFGVLGAAGLLTLAVLCCRMRAASVTRAKRLQASAEGLEAHSRILRQGSWKGWWFEELRASCLAGSAERKRLRASKALAHAAVKAAGGPEFWGMTVGQLMVFRDEHLPRLKSYCEDHRLAPGDKRHVCMRSPCPHDHGEADYGPPNSEDEALAPLPLNMHLVVALVIKPCTKDHMGIYGYATLSNLELPKKAETFISHCWNERFEDFVNTLGTLRRESVVWVCSFAMPQNVDISRLLCTDLCTSPFARALLASDRVLLVVDDDIEPLTRSWCCYEVYLAVKNRLRFELRPPQTSTDLYRKVREKLVAMDIRRCDASNKCDHSRIMTAIRGFEDAVNSKICEIVEDTLIFLESHVP